MEGGPDYKKDGTRELFERWNVLECKLLVQVAGSTSAMNYIKDYTSPELKLKHCLVSVASSAGYLATFTKLDSLLQPLVTTSYSKYWASPLPMCL